MGDDDIDIDDLFFLDAKRRMNVDIPYFDDVTHFVNLKQSK